MRTSLTLCAAGLAAVLGLAPPSASAQSDDGSSVEVAILEIMLERGLIDRPQYDELLALARAKVESRRDEIDVLEGRLERLRAPDVQAEGGKGGKLTFKSADGKWSMNIKGRVQARVTDLDHDNGDKSGTNFSTPRVRLGVAGNAGEEFVKYKVEFDMGTEKKLYDDDTGDPNEGRSFNLKDAYVDIAACEGAALEFGQFKFPFGREELISSGNITLMERSVASGTFSPGHEPGAMLHGAMADGTFEYFAALSNGAGQSLPNAEHGDGDGLRSGVRVVYNPMGPLKADGPAFQTVGDNSTKLGIGLSLMKNDDSSGKNALALNTDTDTTGVDVQFLSGPFSVLAEYFDRTADPSGAPNVDDTGSTLQLGYFVVPSVWELVARTSSVDFDTAADVDELTLGVNRFIDGHNAKWMFDINNRNVDGANADSQEIRVQYQAIF